MVSSTVIGDIGRMVRGLIENYDWSGIDPTPIVTLQSPREIERNQQQGNMVSLFLYQISENPYLKNQGIQVPEEGGESFPPLYLDLHYLVTPYSTDPLQTENMLGTVMQILTDNAIITGSKVPDTIAKSVHDIHVIHQPLNIDEMTKIWSAFQDTGYHLSVSYLVTPIPIASTRHVTYQRVISKEFVYGSGSKERED
jgi:hypothetical protein